MNMNNYTVYMHICPNGKYYIGITSMDTPKRWNKGYGYKPYKNSKGCPYFYKAILKYGWENIKHYILYIELQKEDAEQIEIELITSICHSNNPNFGYNISNGGNSAGRHSELTKQKMSENKKGKQVDNFAQYISQKRKSVVQYSLDLIKIKKYDCIADAQKELNINRTLIANVCNGKGNTAGGYAWKWEQDKRKINHIDIKNKKAREINQYDLDNNFIKKWINILEATKHYNLSTGVICNVCKGNRKTAGGYIWRYAK